MTETPITILVVDDSEFIRRSMRALLDSCGYQVFVASSADEADALFESNAFDVILTDLLMPERDGLSLLRSVQQRRRFQPVIVLSGSLDLNRAMQLTNAGAFRLAEKPVDSGWLFQAIEDAKSFNDLLASSEKGLSLSDGPTDVGAVDSIEKVSNQVAEQESVTPSEDEAGISIEHTGASCV